MKDFYPTGIILQSTASEKNFSLYFGILRDNPAYLFLKKKPKRSFELFWFSFFYIWKKTENFFLEFGGFEIKRDFRFDPKVGNARKV